MNKKKILVFIISFVCTLIYAGPINWAVSMTSFPSDQNIGDSGQEKIPNGYVDLMAGNLVFDIPEVTLKGDRGLDFTLSRSYGKVNNGFRSMGNWELESPRLVMMTGASTQLQGDYNGQGICQSNGDYNNNQSGDAVFNTSIIDSGYKNEIKSSYVELANINYLKRIASALTNVSPQKAGDLGTTELYTVNKEGAKNILNGLMFVNSDNDGSKVSQQLESMTQNLVNKNKAYIEAYKFNLATSFGLMNTLVKVNNITKMEIRYTSGKTVIIEVPYIYTYELGGRLFSARLIKALADPDIATQNFTLLLYNGSKAITSLKGLSANNDLPISQLMPLFYTVNYVQISLSLMNLTWAYSENGVETIPKPFAWDSTDLFTPTLNEANTTIWRIKTREKSTSDFELYSKVDPRQRPMSLYIPGQKNITFYPVDGATQYPASTKYASQDNWIISCENSGNDFRVRSPNGMTYLFPKDNRENQTGFPTLFGNQYIPGRVTIHASKVENQFGEAYQLSYQKIENTNRTYDGYNNSSKFFLEKVFHQLDGNNVSSNPDLILTYGKFAASGIVSTAFDDFKNNVGDIVVTGINRYVNNKYIPWKKYQYYFSKISSKYKIDEPLYTGSSKTIGQVQSEQAGNVYLYLSQDSTGDYVVYEYGGPFRIMGNHPKSNNGVTQQGYIWFYTDLTGAAYFKKASSIASTALVAKWDYTLFSFDRDGYSESKSYRVNNSTYSGQDVNQYQVKYGYSLNSNNNEQTTTVTTSDSKTGLNKSSSYIMYSFARGDSENIFHGILKQIKTDNREENYTWQTLPTIIGKKPKVTKEDQYTGEENVYLLRLAGKTINHNGTYSTTYSDFDLYGNAKNIMSTGMIGSNSITLPYSIIEYYNSDPKNSAVNDGSLPWLVGLPRSKKTEGYTTQVTNYDSQGAIINDQKEGRFTQYKYATTTFSSCLGALADFSWSKFTGCISNYMNDRHNGLVIEKNIGNGKEITNYSAYYKGVPTQIKNANGGLETNKVDDFGNITEHKDADNVVSKNQYDDAGRLIVDTPIVGLAYTTINYDGLNITKTLNNGGTSLTRLEKYNGDGLLIYSEDRAANKTIVNSTVYDAFGNVTFKANPTTGGMNGGISTTYDIFNRPLTVNDNGVSINYCYQNCDGRTGAITLTTDAYGTTESDYLAFGDFSTGLKTTTLRKGSDGEQFKTATEYNLALLKPFSAISGNSSQSYSYNPNGTLATEKDNSIPGQKSYGYDDTGRIRTITHQDGSSESINYYPFNNLIASRSWRGMTTSYGYTNAGRLISSNNGATSQSYVPDAFGRVKSITQNINSDNLNKAYTTTYNYNNLNQVINIVYPSGKVANFSNQNAFGEISAIPNVIQSLNYNALHQLTTVQANSNVVWSYSYSNNGLLTNVTASGLNPCTLNISYKYDALNRINTLIDSCGTTYNATITRYGTGLMKQVELNQARYSYNYNNDDITNVNIVSKSQTVQPATYVYNYVNGTSRLGNVSGSRYGFSYDAMGNVINDGIRALSYDAYYRISKNGNETYIYNSEGLRVRAIRDDGITDYVYDGGGTLIYDINHKSGYNRTYIYVAGKLLATLENFPDTNSKGYDNLTDFEAAEFGVNSLLESYQDSDDDGLPDYIERLIGSDPNNPDTDGDGYKDGYEYKTLGPKGVLDANIHPNEPDPDEEMAAWLPPILDMILDDDN